MLATSYSRVVHLRTDDSHRLQRTRCELVAVLHGFELTADSYADTGMSRGEFLRLLDDGRAGKFDVVIVDRASRLPKALDPIGRLAQAGLQLVTEDGVDQTVPAAQRYAEQVQQAADATGTLRLV
jgi:DNA invertase Pin-like site-specific DNA recombinase